MKVFKVISKLIFMSFIFFIYNFTIVDAAEIITNDDNTQTQGAVICVDGYKYYFSTSYNGGNLYDFTNLYALDDAAKEDIITKNNGTYRKDDVLFNFSRTETYFSEQQIRTRCYTYYKVYPETEEITVDDNGYVTTNTTQRYSYQTKQCGNNYDTRLNFYTDSSDNRIENMIKYNENNDSDKVDFYSESFKSNIIENDGTITLKLTPSTGDDETEPSKLANPEIWNRLRVFVEYDGGASRGNCTVTPFTDQNGNYGPSIKCTGISPYKPIIGEVAVNNRVDRNNRNTENVTRKIINKSQYTIHLYLKGVTTSDFGENVDEETKRKYVENCGGNKNDNTVGEIYLGSLSTSIIEEDVIAIPNPNINKTNAEVVALCDQVAKLDNASTELKKVYIPECYNNKITLEQFNNQVELISSKLKNLQDGYSSLITNYTTLSQVAKSEEGLLCTDMRMGIPNNTKNDNMTLAFESKVVYEDYGEYFGIICTEDYYVDGGVPSLVAAGTGVEYSNKVQIDKKCTIIQLQQVRKKDQCQSYTNTYIRFDHGNDGIVNDGDTNGGPNSQFDSCVESCDGGKYTQKCINSCYSSTYTDDRSELVSDANQMNFNFSDKYKTTKIAEYSTNGAIINAEISGEVENHCTNGICLNIDRGAWSEGAFQGSPNDWIITVSDSNGNILDQAGSSAACNANLTVFTNSYTGPPGCSNDPEGEYKIELEKAHRELQAFVNLANSDSQLQEYSISLTDTVTGDIYKITGTTTQVIEDQPQLIITKNKDLSKKKIEETTNFQIGLNGSAGNVNAYKKANNKMTLSTVYNIELPIAHVKKDNSGVIVVENNEGSNARYFHYPTSEKDEKEISYFIFDEYNNWNSAMFRNGEKVYYTNIHSPFYNVRVNPGETAEDLNSLKYRDAVSFTTEKGRTIYELVNNKENIKVTLTIGGISSTLTSDYSYKEYKIFDSSEFDCYYGVYPFIFDTECKGEYCDPDPTPTPTGGGKPSYGLRYYYREIDLNNVFNNRNPRWNWTGTIKGGKATGAANNDDSSYIVDPEKLIADIEKKGESIYNNSEEIDYEFTMTTNIINTIREYNNSNITYLDFSLVGNVKDKKNYSQKIRDWYDGNSLLYSAAYAITECNNAISGKCDTN